MCAGPALKGQARNWFRVALRRAAIKENGDPTPHEATKPKKDKDSGYGKTAKGLSIGRVNYLQNGLSDLRKLGLCLLRPVKQQLFSECYFDRRDLER
jgi:hypothetical protein